MSKKYTVHLDITYSKYFEDIEANTPEEAENEARSIAERLYGPRGFHLVGTEIVDSYEQEEEEE